MLAALTEASAIRNGRPRRRNPAGPEGRWSLAGTPADEDEESQRLAWMHVLLDRYGIVSRELVELDPWAPAWAELAPWLARAELRGELRRGYFVEGFSGVQYASEEAAAELARLAGSSSPDTADVLLAAADPANLYGSGAPLDIPLLDGGTARLSRIPGNYLVLRERPARARHRGPRQAADRPGLGVEAGTRRGPDACRRSSPARAGRSSRSRPTTASPRSPARSPPASPSWASSAITPA